MNKDLLKELGMTQADMDKIERCNTNNFYEGYDSYDYKNYGSDSEIRDISSRAFSDIVMERF